MDQETIDKANKIYDEGDMAELHEFIKPFLEKDDPYALYFYSRSSLPNESNEEYDKRYVDSLIKAAKGNVPEAMYQLSALYFTGDTVELDVHKGKDYLDRAIKFMMTVPVIKIIKQLGDVFAGFVTADGNADVALIDYAEKNLRGWKQWLLEVDFSVVFLMGEDLSVAQLAEFQSLVEVMGL